MKRESVISYQLSGAGTDHRSPITDNSHSRTRTRAFTLPKQRGRSCGFTLAEMLVSIAVLTLVVVFVAQLTKSAVTITTLGHKRMDADSQARQFFDRMAVDFNQMLTRNDVSYFLKAADGVTNNMTTGSSSVGMNDRMAFFSGGPGYLASTQQSYPSNLGLVAYRVNAAYPGSVYYNIGTYPRLYNRVERMGKGLNLNGAYSGAIAPIAFANNLIPMTIAGVWPAATDPAKYLDQGETTTDYEVAGPQVFRLEYYYLTNASPPTLVAYPSGWTTVNSINIKDVKAIIVAIATIDPRSRAILDNSQTVPAPNDNITKLAGRLVDFDSSTMGTPGQLVTNWQSRLNGITDMPRTAIQNVRLYERYFYLNQW
jgi:prepilin-type N-terminal cleavage/methylation domain-containing protein